MKILTTLHGMKHISDLSQWADGFIISFKSYSKSVTYDFTNEIIETLNLIKDNKREVFINFNKMYTDQEIIELSKFINTLPIKSIDGFIFADLGLLNMFKELNITEGLVYNPETLLTNPFDFNYLKEDGFYGGVVSRDITLDDIISIGKKKNMKLFYQGHGHTTMFYSKREILSSFNEVLDGKLILKDEKTLKLKEKNRRTELFPILEDDSGTHVYRGYVLATNNYINQLKEVVDYLMIDTIFKDDLYAKKVLPIYKENINSEIIKMELEAEYKEEWHDGLLFNKTTIKGDKI